MSNVFFGALGGGILMLIVYFVNYFMKKNDIKVVIQAGKTLGKSEAADSDRKEVKDKINGTIEENNDVIEENKKLLEKLKEKL